jgi:hypothetical protein
MHITTTGVVFAALALVNAFFGIWGVVVARNAGECLSFGQVWLGVNFTCAVLVGILAAVEFLAG